jgi:hypothetical protein
MEAIARSSEKKLLAAARHSEAKRPLDTRSHTRKMLQLMRLTRKMPQTIKKTLPSIAGRFVHGMAFLLAASTATAFAQTPAETPAQTAPPKTTAAPGTVAISKANAEALAATAYTGPKYDNRWEIYGGLSFMNGQAGQNTPVRYDMGGGEVQGTYWLGGAKDGYLRRHLGLTADDRFGAGTTPVISPYYNRVLVIQDVFSGGVTFRGPKNRYAAMDFHALAGGTDGIFDYAVNHYPGGSPVSSCPADQQPGQRGNLGLYCNHIAPWGTAGGSVEFNQSAKLAIRLQPDMIFEHFGTETHEYFSISMGVVYRFAGKKK